MMHEACLLKDLQSWDSMMRSSAAEKLGWAGSRRAEPALIGCLHDPSRSVRIQASSSLGLIGSRKAFAALAKRVGDERSRVARFYFLDSLTMIGRRIGTHRLPGLDRLVVLLKRSAKTSAGLEMAGVLYSLGKRRYLSVLVSALNSRSMKRRMAAVNVLGMIWIVDQEDQELVKMRIRALLRRGEAEECRIARVVIRSLGDSHCADVLTKVNVVQQLASKDNFMRYEAAERIGWMRKRSAVPALTACLRDRNSMVRLCAAEALGAMRLPPLVPRLMSYAEQERDTLAAVYAIDAVATIAKSHPRMVPRVLRWLHSLDRRKRKERLKLEIAAALYWLGRHEQFDRLARGLKSIDCGTRGFVANMLASITVNEDAPRALDCLRAALRKEMTKFVRSVIRPCIRAIREQLDHAD